VSIASAGFGCVFLAHADQLQWHVAIKQPHARLVSRPEDVETYLVSVGKLAVTYVSREKFGKSSSKMRPFLVVARTKRRELPQNGASSSRSVGMRKAFSRQQRLDCRGVLGVQLNVECRDEIIPVLRGLQQIYAQPALRDEILGLIAQDVNRKSRDDVGREGIDYWEILVLASVRLGCNLDYDKLQDLAEQHRALRHIMGIGDWKDDKDFGWRRIRDNICLLTPDTIDRISQLIVAEGHRLNPEAAKQARADSFVVETNIHWPSESTLIRDGVGKIIELCVSADAKFPPFWPVWPGLMSGAEWARNRAECGLGSGGN